MAKKNREHTSVLTEKEILRQRAKTLAEPIKEALSEWTNDHQETLCFSLKNELYSIDIQYITESLRLHELIPIPGTSSLLTGITHIRGRIIPVVNLKAFFHLGQQGIPASPTVVILSKNQTEVAILVDDISGTRWISASAIKPPPSTVQGISLEHIQGITADGIILIHGERLLSTLHQQLTQVQL